MALDSVNIRDSVPSINARTYRGWFINEVVDGKGFRKHPPPKRGVIIAAYIRYHGAHTVGVVLHPYMHSIN
jgi:hypothetical protein